MKNTKNHNSQPKTDKNVNKTVTSEKVAQNQLKGKALVEADHEMEAGADAVDYDSQVFEKFGPPFLAKTSGKVTLNERAIAVECATKYKVKYIAATKTYERYDEKTGLWKSAHASEIHALLGELLFDLGKAFKQEDAVQLVGSAKLNSLSRMLQPFHFETVSEDVSKLFHVSNGILDLRGSKPVKIAHDPKYPFNHSSGVEYQPKAKCPRFLGEFLEPALPPYDIELIQKYFGSVLLGSNVSQTMLIIRGVGGSGKSTLVNLAERVWGQNLVAEMRTKHMNGRFETSAFLGKRVLVGKDVPGDTLQEKGARMLKSLTGGDLLQAEIKYNPTKQELRGDYHVVIVSNSRLRIALEGDGEAWDRRIRVVDFDQPMKPKKRIMDFAGVLFNEESSGILNWMIEGAMKFQDEMKSKRDLVLNEVQMKRVKGMLNDSDSVLSFVDQRVVESEDVDVTSEELLLGYYEMCKQRQWTPVSSHEFQTRMPDLVAQKFEVCRRNDIMRDGRAVRGFKHISMN